MKTLVESVAQARIDACLGTINNSLEKAAEGNPFGAEPQRQRVLSRLQTKAGLTPREAEAVTQAIEGAQKRTRSPEPRRPEGLESRDPHPTSPRPPAPEAIWGDTLDFVNVAFLEKGARVARSVGRVARPNGQPVGSGFLIGEGLFLTNHHVISDLADAGHMLVEFDYEIDLAGRPRAVTRYRFDTSVFVTDPVEGLDFTVVAIGDRLDGDCPLSDLGWSRLSDAPDKHMLGEFVNIVQHPAGRFKEVVLRENRLVARSDMALHYVADTQPGSSGSPVYNSEWQVVGLHHWGGSLRLTIDEHGNPLPIDVNEAIRVSAIVRNLRARLADMGTTAATRISAALALPEALTRRDEPRAAPENAVALPRGPRMDADGRVSWSIPLEVSVQVPWLAAPTPPLAVAGEAPVRPAAVARAEAKPPGPYNDRSGYKPRFIEGHDIPLPRLAADIAAAAAVNRKAGPGDDPHELRYHHFSVVVNKLRRLAFFTACNIDGASAKSIVRGTDTIRALTDADIGSESFAEGFGAETAETWYADDRLDPADYAGAAIYQKQVVPGFAAGAGRTARMFQRGHLVRRLDPVWGDDNEARAAELDTFHWTNCTPQVGYFNQGTAAATLPGSGGGNLWRAVENYVLRGALAEKQRVTSFTGPIFAPDDPPYRGIQIPGRFFKIVVWSEGGKLKSLAMIADQRPVLAIMPEAFGEPSPETGGEAFQSPGQLALVGDFLSTIAEVERATQLDFGKAVRNADVRAGAALAPVADGTEMAVAIRSGAAREPRSTRPGK